MKSDAILVILLNFIIIVSSVLFQGKVKQAHKALRMLYGSRYKVDEELQIIQDNLRQQREKTDEFRTKEDEQVSKINISIKTSFFADIHPFVIF